jgi:hypothetical protein
MTQGTLFNEPKDDKPEAAKPKTGRPKVNAAKASQPKVNKINSEYKAEDIQVLEGRQAVRRRPARPAPPGLRNHLQLHRRGHGRLL